MKKSQVISTYDVYGKEYSVEADDLKIAVHVYGLARKGNQILILPAWDGYDFPGGTAMVGETHLETLTREFKEETGYDIKPIRPLEIYTSFFSSPCPQSRFSELSHLLRSRNNRWRAI